MDVRDLMIGDYVRDMSHNQLQKVIGFRTVEHPGLAMEVTPILQSQEKETKGDISYIAAYLLEPVLLTNDMLKANEFEPIPNEVVDEAYIFNRDYWGKPDLIIRRFDFNDSFVLCACKRVLASIAYVHELQHALKLFYVKKEITIKQ